MKKLTLSVVSIATVISFFSFQQKPEFDLKASMERGKEIYNAQCITCHMEKGEGIESVYPPLAKSDYLMKDKERSVKQIINGVSGEIVVNGITYNGDMPGFAFTDEEVSDVLNYIRNAWGNKGEAVKPEDVKSARN